MAKPAVRKQSKYVPLTREQFRERFFARFYDPAFDSVKAELEKVFEKAWDGYIVYRKSPRTKPAGSGYAKSDFRLPVEWLEARAAIDAAQKLLHETGHGDSDGPWLPIGVGVHTGVAFLGSVGSYEHAVDIAVLGDPPNVAARLSSSAATGEILISDDAYVRGMKLANLEQRQLTLKGKSQPLSVHVMKASL